MFDKSAERFPIKEKYTFLTHCGIAPLYANAMRKEREVAEDDAEQRGGGEAAHGSSSCDRSRLASTTSTATMPAQTAKR